MASKGAFVNRPLSFATPSFRGSRIRRDPSDLLGALWRSSCSAHRNVLCVWNWLNDIFPNSWNTGFDRTLRRSLPPFPQCGSRVFSRSVTGRNSSLPDTCHLHWREFPKAKQSNIRIMSPFHSQEWSISNFPCSLTLIITSYSVENLAFHSLLKWKMIILPILTTSLIHFRFRRFRECTFWTRVNSGGYLSSRFGEVNIRRYSPTLRRIILFHSIYNTSLIAIPGK